MEDENEIPKPILFLQTPPQIEQSQEESTSFIAPIETQPEAIEVVEDIPIEVLEPITTIEKVPFQPIQKILQEKWPCLKQTMLRYPHFFPNTFWSFQSNGDTIEGKIICIDGKNISIRDIQQRIRNINMDQIEDMGRIEK